VKILKAISSSINAVKFIADLKSAKYQMFIFACVALWVGKLPWQGWVAAAAIFTGANMYKHYLSGDYSNGNGINATITNTISERGISDHP
jgi:hypothetical protein